MCTGRANRYLCRNRRFMPHMSTSAHARGWTLVRRAAANRSPVVAGRTMKVLVANRDGRPKSPNPISRGVRACRMPG
jgi:hypothetical protein